MSKQPIKKPLDQGPRPHAKPKMSIADLEANYPLLTGYLFDCVYEDGSPRVTSTLLFFSENGELKVCLNDRDTLRVAFATVPGVVEALTAIEEALSSDTIVWRQKRS